MSHLRQSANQPDISEMPYGESIGRAHKVSLSNTFEARGNPNRIAGKK